MTEQEIETAIALERLHPDLGALFRSAHALIERGVGPGDTYLLSVAARELTNGVVGSLDTILDEEHWSETPPSELERHRKSLARTLGLPTSDPMVTQWFAAHDAFNKGCHWGDSISSAALVEHFRTLSGILVGRLGPFFDIQDDLGRLAAIEQPTSADAARLRSLLLLPVQREHFFERVSSPNWLEHLEPLDAFRRLPRNPPADRWADLARWASWPEGQYLARIAGERPNDVQRILLGAPAQSDNPLVWRRILAAAMALPVDHAAAVVEVLIRRAQSFPIAATGSLPVDVATRLLQLRRVEGMNLLTALLTLKRSATLEQAADSTESAWRWEKEPYFDRIAGHLNDELLEKAIPAAIAFDPLTLARRLRPHLKQAIQLATPEGSEASSSKSWCRDLGKVQSERSVRGILLTLFARSLVEAARSGDLQGVEELLGKCAGEPHDAFTRAAWFVLAEVGELLPGLRSTALADERLLEVWWGSREAAHLLRRQLESAPIADQLVVRHAFERGPSPSDLAAMLKWREVHEPTDSDVKREIANWQRTKLRWFRGQVPSVLSSLATRLGVAGLVPTLEEQELAEDHSTSVRSGWVAPRLPASAEPWTEWMPEARLQFLLDWRPQERSEFADERAGLLQMVREWAEIESNDAVNMLMAFGQKIPSGAIHAMLEGIYRASDGGKQIALTFIDTMSRRFVAPLAPAENTEPLSTRAETCLREILRVVKKTADRNQLSQDDIPRIFDAINMIANASVVRDQGEVVLDQKGFARAQMHGWNALGGELVQAIVSLGLFLFRSRSEVDQRIPFAQHEYGTQFRHNLVSAMDLLLDANGICGAAVRHQIGQYLPQLNLLDAEWVEAKVVPHFAKGINDPDADPIWPAYLVWGRMYDDLFRQWAVWYTQAATAMPVETVGEGSEGKPFEHLVLHLTIAYLRGLADLNENSSAVVAAYRRAPASILSHLYWRLYRDFADAVEPPPAQMVDRLEQLWKWRVTELETANDTSARAVEAAGLIWFVASEHVSAASALALGLKTVPWLVDDGVMLRLTWERMNDFLNEDAGTTLRLVIELLRAHARGPFPHLSTETVRETCALMRGLVDDAQWGEFVDVVADLARHGWSDVRSILP